MEINSGGRSLRCPFPPSSSLSPLPPSGGGGGGSKTIKRVRPRANFTCSLTPWMDHLHRKEGEAAADDKGISLHFPLWFGREKKLRGDDDEEKFQRFQKKLFSLSPCSCWSNYYLIEWKLQFDELYTIFFRGNKTKALVFLSLTRHIAPHLLCPT